MDQQINQIKDTVLELINNIVSRTEDIAGIYSFSNALESDRIVNLLDDLQVLSEGIEVIKEFYVNLDLSELSEKLEMMEAALDRKDDRLLADIMQFELKDLLLYWETSLSD